MIAERFRPTAAVRHRRTLRWNASLLSLAAAPPSGLSRPRLSLPRTYTQTDPRTLLPRAGGSLRFPTRLIPISSLTCPPGGQIPRQMERPHPGLLLCKGRGPSPQFDPRRAACLHQSDGLCLTWTQQVGKRPQKIFPKECVTPSYKWCFCR